MTTRRVGRTRWRVPFALVAQESAAAGDRLVDRVPRDLDAQLRRDRQVVWGIAAGGSRCRTR
ncbi:hypothetical protein [Actinoalloteichus hymeniacidonis]|uniref:hypothetical protein n=1 Tax=Actinoalloteichus hymeniacidonis TaxID=340345 RepID=UPI000853D2AC|nr:hypothetical protein [Actinoalloteichus hymeniacidonis]MBB5908110.1 hypothetical protein [Actinoalloteichus hymeniacidonis]